METKQPVDVPCRGGIRIFAVPVFAGEEVVGSISIGYGDPPCDPGKLDELATTYGVSAEELRLHAEAYEKRPPAIIDLAKKQLLSLARFIGELVRRKQAEQALRRSEERFHAVFDLAKDMIYILDQERRLIDANRAACEALDYSRDELRSMAPLDIDMSDPAEHDERMEALQRRGYVRFETLNRKRDGTFFPVEVSLQFLDLAGSLVILAICRDISKRKQTEEALLLMQFAMDQAPDSILLVGDQGNLEYANNAACASMGFTREELLSMKVFDIDPDFPVEGWEQHKKNLKLLGKMTFRGRHRTKDGRLFPVEVTTNYLEYRGRFLGVSFDRDITERLHFEEALEKRILALTKPLDENEGIAFEDLFNLSDVQHLQDLLAETWGVAALITRPDGTPITKPSNFTPFCSEFIRSTEKGFRKCQVSDAAIGRHDPTGPIIQTCLSAGLCGAGASITVGGRHIASWLIGQVRNEEQNEEQIVKYCHELGFDETAFREAYRKVPFMAQEKFEQIAHALFALANQLSIRAYQNIQQARFIAERKRVEEALRESEARFRLVVESSPLPIGFADQDGRIEYLNPKFSEMFGYVLEDIPTLADWYRCVFPDPKYRKSTVERLEKVLERPENPNDDITHAIELEVTCKDGSVRNVEYFRTRMGSKTLAIFSDLTERKKIEEERRRFDVQMREVQKLESLGVLAGGIAHDFNNLLMAILGYADLALLSLSPVSPARQYLEEITRASQRASDLCRQMLAYSGKGRFVIGRYNLSEIVKEMGQILDVSVSKKAVMRYFLAEGLPAVESDVTQIRQVIMNLITNAADALGDSRGVITVTTGAMECDEAYLAESYLNDNLPGGTYVYLDVSDTGCGMDDATRSRIFDPFFTTKFVGRGLGLAAVLGIVRGHRGAIKVNSEVGKGTSFKILLPAVEWEPGEKAKAVEQGEFLQGGGAILLIDDDPFVRNVVSAMLVTLGFQVLTADNGLEGLKVFRAHEAEIACVLLDLMMPEMGGEETFRELRNLKRTIPVILSSGYNEQEVTQRFVGKGLTGFVQKPYTVANLRRVLKSALG